MREVQLYIKPEGSTEYIKVDLFDDESISLTQTIKNAKDVSKLFTDFSKSFTIPASKTNNQIFKHYHRFPIDNGFDGRKRVDAKIEINRVPFKTGRVKLDGVELKNDKAYAYKITFFGNTIKIKDQLGEEKLSALDSLSENYNTIYGVTEVKTALQADPTTNDVVVPLITHSQRLTYGSGLGANSGDLKPGGNNGVLWSQLKYAIRVDAVVQAIADRYGFTFADNSFFDVTVENPNPNYYNLFMWLHRKKGDVGSDFLSEPPSLLIDGFTGNTDPNEFVWTNATGSQIILEDIQGLTTFSLDVQNTSGNTYNISVLRDGIEVISRQNVGSTLNLDVLAFAKVRSDYEVYVSANATIPSSAITFTWTALIESEGSQQLEEFNWTIKFDIGTDPVFDITQQIPDMKVIDFLSGIFKMFNLIAEVDENNVVDVRSLDDYYEEGVVRDITRYVDNSSSNVDAAIPYAEVELKYKDTQTILSAQYNQLFNREWGSETWSSQDELKEGGKFTLDLPFSHMQFERLNDISTSSITEVMYGYFVDDNQDAYIGSPLLFYPILNTLDVPISFVTGTDASGNFNAVETIAAGASIIVPSNSRTLDGGVDNEELDNINFSLESNEYAAVDTNTTVKNLSFYKTLFYNYYYDYIASLFATKKRTVKVNANLPVSFLINYSLADTITIQGLKYKINSITTDLSTGKSNLELLNVVPVNKLTYGGGGNELTVTVSGQTSPAELTTYSYSASVGGTATGLITYSWSIVNGNGTIQSGQGSSTVSILWDNVTGSTADEVKCTVTRSGIVKSGTLPVTIQDSAATGISVTLLENGSTTLSNNVYELTQYTYSVSLGGSYTEPVTYSWNIVGGTPTSSTASSVTVLWDDISSPTAGTVSVTATSADSPSNSDTVNHYLTVLPESVDTFLDVYARVQLEPAAMDLRYSVNGGAYTILGTYAVGTICGLMGRIPGLSVGDVVTLQMAPTFDIMGNDTSSCPGDFTAPTGDTYTTSAIVEGANVASLNIDTVSSVYQLGLGFGNTAYAACQDYIVNGGFPEYADGVSLQGATKLFEDENGYAYQDRVGWYSDGFIAKYWDGSTTLDLDIFCSDTTPPPGPEPEERDGVTINGTETGGGPEPGTEDVGGWVLQSDACAGTGGIVYISLYVDPGESLTIGTVLYTTISGPGVFNGGFRWFQDGAGGIIYVDDAGVITDVATC